MKTFSSPLPSPIVRMPYAHLTFSPVFVRKYQRFFRIRSVSVAKMEGPEEFFEAFRTSHRKPVTPSDPSVRTSAGDDEPQESADPEPDAPAGETARRPLSSVFSESEPTITLRRSTLIFSLVLVFVLLFIAYAMGTSRARQAPSAGQKSSQTAAPKMTGQWAIVLKEFRTTDSSSLANATDYRNYLRQKPEVLSNKDAFILSSMSDRKLLLCVGPFQYQDSPQVSEILPRLRTLQYLGVRQFGNAQVQPLPSESQVIN